MSLDISTASELDKVHTPQPNHEGRSTPSPDSGYASTTPTPERTPQCDQEELELPTGKFFKRKIRLKVFQEEIPTHVKDRFLDLQELFDRPLYERLVSSGNSFGPMSSKLKRLGESEQTSAYWLVIQCEPKMARRVRQFFDQDHVKSEYQPRNESADLPWFNIWVCPKPPMRLAMDDEVDEGIFLDVKERTLCGTLVKVQDRIATIGGVIMVKAQGEESLYCLTIGHILPMASSLAGVWDARDEEEQDLSDTESEASLGSDEIELDSAPSDDPREGKTLGSSKVDLLRPRPIRFVEGTQCKTKRCFDWALAALNEADLYRPNCRIRASSNDEDDATVPIGESDELRETDQRSTRLAVPRRIVVLGGVSGFGFGILSGSPSCYMSESSTSFAQMYTLTLKAGSVLEVGDCGSWIVDEATNEVYGHVVASDIFGEVYVAPLKETLKQVEEVLRADSVSLPTRAEVAAWIDVHGARLEGSQVLLNSEHDFVSDLAWSHVPSPPQQQLDYSEPQNTVLDSAYASESRSPSPHLNLVSPYVADGTLKKYLEKPKPADFCREELFYSISGLASAIWALHEFVLEDTAPSLKDQHQDLRPDNILVDGNRFILADFGLSSIKSTQEDSRTPFKGLKGYCQAPECADLRHPYREYETTRKTDIFALGCIIADLLVYSVKGTSGVGAFLDDRKFEESPMCYSLYHKGDSANDAVAAWLENLVSENQSQSLRDMVDLVVEMLDILPKNRPEAAIVTARLYMNTIMAFSEQFYVLFDQFTPSPVALIERARFSSWAMSQDVQLYSDSSDATTTGKFWGSTVDILRQMKKALESIDKTRPNYRSFIKVRTLNIQLLNTLSSERRSSARSRLSSIVLANTTLRDALGDSYLNRRAETQHLVAQVEDATAPFPTPISQLLGGPDRYVRTIGRYHVAKLRDKKDNHNKSVIVETIQYQDQLRRQRLLPRIHALCKLLSSEQLDQELRIPKFYGLHDNTQAFCFEIIYEFPGEHHADNLQLMPISLRELLTEREPYHYPSWETRLRLGLELAESLAAFHDVTWFHKDLTSFNVLFFPTTQTAPSARATHPYLLGSQHSRSATDDFTEGPLQDRVHQRYHHPRYVSLETRHFTRFRPQFDWYSLGILLIEIGLWEAIDKLMHEHAQKDNFTFSEHLIQYKLSALSFHMGDKYVDIVKECLTGLNEKPEKTDEREQLDLATNLMLKDKVVIPLKSLDRTRSTQGVDKKRK